MKYLFDFFVSLFLYLLFSPLMLIVSIFIYIADGRPIIFCQQRVGKDGKIFNIFKFRTMKPAKKDYDESFDDHLRMTKLGKFLRETSLDELPSLWNVLIGDMSLVGPRPLLVEYLPLYNQRQARRHEVRPGITGWAQVNGRNALSWEDKFELDVWYVDNQSFWLDLKILCLTIKKVLLREGINSGDHATTEKFKGKFQ